MRTFYEKKEILFAVLWIVVYCVVMAHIRENYGDDSLLMLGALTLISAGIITFVKAYKLEEKYGLVKWQGAAREYWFFIPMLIIMTGNLWGGFEMDHSGINQVLAVFSMLLVGFVEEMLFRGFLFRALLKKDPVPVAIFISAVTFGIGHIINLFTGQASLETVIQIVYAVAFGFLTTMVFYKSGSLIVCIFVHGMVDVFSKFGNTESSEVITYTYIGVSIVISAVYCVYLSRKPTALAKDCDKK